MKLANYGLDHWLTLPRYVPEEDTRLMLKSCYRQYQQYSKVRTMLKNNLISLLDTAFPDANRLFTSPPRADGSEKWVDFVAAFWHCECVCGLSEKAFTAKYQKWCKKHGYNFSEDKALDIYASACGHFGVMPKTDTAKLLVEQAISQLRTTSAALAALKQEMQSLAASLPEYPVVMEMFGVGPALGPNSWLKLAMCAVFIPRNRWWPLQALTPLLTNPAKWIFVAAAFPSGICLAAQNAFSGDGRSPAMRSNG